MLVFAPCLLHEAGKVPTFNRPSLRRWRVWNFRPVQGPVLKDLRHRRWQVRRRGTVQCRKEILPGQLRKSTLVLDVGPDVIEVRTGQDVGRSGPHLFLRLPLRRIVRFQVLLRSSGGDQAGRRKQPESFTGYSARKIRPRPPPLPARPPADRRRWVPPRTAP